MPLFLVLIDGPTKGINLTMVIGLVVRPPYLSLLNWLKIPLRLPT